MKVNIIDSYNIKILFVIVELGIFLFLQTYYNENENQENLAINFLLIHNQIVSFPYQN